MTSTMRFDKWENTLGQPYGTVLQTTYFETTSRLSGFLGGSTNPTSAEGTLFASTSFTPKFDNSKILIQSSSVVMGELSNTGDEFYMAGYYDTTRVAIAITGASYTHFSGALGMGVVNFNHVFSSWGTTTKTINVRVGAHNTGVNMYVNQNFHYNVFSDTTRTVGFTLMEIAQ